MANPDASEEQIWHIWARRHLGDELYEKVYGEKIANDREQPGVEYEQC
jgi:hypothetical protein